MRPGVRLGQGQDEILALADGRRTPRDLAFALGRGVYATTLQLARMHQAGLLVSGAAQTTHRPARQAGRPASGTDPEPGGLPRSGVIATEGNRWECAIVTDDALLVAQRLASEARQGTLREAVTRGSGGYVAIYAVGAAAVLILLGDEGLDVARLHRESRAAVESIEKLLRS